MAERSAQSRERLTPRQIEIWSTRFALLGDPTRLALLVEMHREPDLAVAELAERVGITENAASQSLRALRDSGWVRTARAGRRVRYSMIDDAVVHQILHDVVGIAHVHGHPHSARHPGAGGD
ncbi:ArsR/SmtB family transcription factor [Gordonia sp. LUNF6]|uniref:ArsR/SmtB family transcription factor n=1 Tax=Gordonia TaxID=2053 RepID=UPI002416123F|nr:metalloregulator ArsR/SmtB family transcription factor [Gordonia sihwensis]WFN93620.1 metalloregulator ArsR/SmtB family transcription factor [Gordonia sihwensis]